MLELHVQVSGKIILSIDPNHKGHYSHSVFIDTERCDDVTGTPPESLNVTTTNNQKYICVCVCVCVCTLVYTA